MGLSIYFNTFETTVITDSLAKQLFSDHVTVRLTTLLMIIKGSNYSDTISVYLGLN